MGIDLKTGILLKIETNINNDETLIIEVSSIQFDQEIDRKLFVSITSSDWNG
jgi:outer membrane lipoprotein-sorting protein